MDSTLASIRVGDTSNPYGLSDATMEWVRAQAKRETEERVARAREQAQLAESAEKENRIEMARAEHVEQVRLGRRLSDAQFESAMWECFEEVEREDGERGGSVQ